MARTQTKQMWRKRNDKSKAGTNVEEKIMGKGKAEKNEEWGGMKVKWDFYLSCKARRDLGRGRM